MEKKLTVEEAYAEYRGVTKDGNLSLESFRFFLLDTPDILVKTKAGREREWWTIRRMTDEDIVTGEPRETLPRAGDNAPELSYPEYMRAQLAARDLVA